MTNLKELSTQEDKLIGGHTLCAGCPESIIARAVLHAAKPKRLKESLGPNDSTNHLGNPVVVVNATGCLEVSTTTFPHTCWKVPYIHNAFPNACSTMAGIERAYESLKRKRKIREEIKFVVFSGDGGLADIGLQAFSGAMERGHNMLVVCIDNGAYMNTGIQRSSTTPFGAWTKTSEVGKVHQGKEEFRKNLMQIAEAHNIKYLAQASPSHYIDLVDKAKKAFETEGVTFLNVISPCVPGWKYPPSQTIRMARLAVETNFWPLYEIMNGKYLLNYEPSQRKPIVEFLKTQGRFRHLLNNNREIEIMQNYVDEEFRKIKRRT